MQYPIILNLNEFLSYLHLLPVALPLLLRIISLSPIAPLITIALPILVIIGAPALTLTSLVPASLILKNRRILVIHVGTLFKNRYFSEDFIRVPHSKIY